MTTAQRIVHLTMKDARERRRVIGLFVIALATSLYTTAPEANFFVNAICGMVTTLVFVAIIAAAVMSDAPLDARTFWRSRPIPSWQTVASKWMLAMLLFAPALVIQWIMLRRFGDDGDVLSHILSSARAGATLTMVVMLAALNSEGAGTFVGLLFLYEILAPVVARELPVVHMPSGLGPLYMLLSFASAMAAVMYVYSGGRYARVVAAIALPLALAVPKIVIPTNLPASNSATVVNPMRATATYRVTVPVPAQEQISVDVAAHGQPGERRVFSNVTAHISTLAGETIRARSNQEFVLSENDTIVPAMSLRWVRKPPFFGSDRHGYSLDLSRNEARTVAHSGVREAYLSGTERVYRAKVLGELPLRRAASVATEHHRVRINDWIPDDSGGTVTVRFDDLTGGTISEDSKSYPEPPRILVLNPRTGEALCPEPSSSNSGNGVIVLGNIARVITEAKLRILLVDRFTVAGNSPPPIPKSWLQDAHVLALHWELVAQYPRRIPLRAE